MSNVNTKAFVEKTQNCEGIQRVSDPGEGQHVAKKVTENMTGHTTMALQKCL